MDTSLSAKTEGSVKAALDLWPKLNITPKVKQDFWLKAEIASIVS